MTCACGSHKSELQTLLDEYNRLHNADPECDEVADLKAKIIKLRGDNPPPCFGEDDCSTMMLVHCPWSIDCGS